MIDYHYFFLIGSVLVAAVSQVLLLSLIHI